MNGNRTITLNRKNMIVQAYLNFEEIEGKPMKWFEVEDKKLTWKERKFKNGHWSTPEYLLVYDPWKKQVASYDSIGKYKWETFHRVIKQLN